MLVKVRYLDGTTELVRPSLLQHLIENHKIREFLRTEGWVVLGIDPVRSFQPKIYSGPDRRRATYRTCS